MVVIRIAEWKEVGSVVVEIQPNPTLASKFAVMAEISTPMPTFATMEIL